MNAITQWNPFRELEDMQKRLSGVLGRFPLTRSTNDERESISVTQWSPLVDVSEEDKSYHIKAELPEIAKDDIKITIENGSLVIRGERKFEKEENDKKYHRIERSYGSFYRSFTLPEDADPKQVSAEVKDGVLQIEIGKSEESQPRQIEVKIS